MIRARIFRQLRTMGLACDAQLVHVHCACLALTVTQNPGNPKPKTHHLCTSIALNSSDAETASTLLWSDCSPQAETRKSKVQKLRIARVPFALLLSILHLQSSGCCSPQHSATPSLQDSRIAGLQPPVSYWDSKTYGAFFAPQYSILNLPSSGCCSRVGHGLARVVSRVGREKRPVFIGLSRCHGSEPPWRPYRARRRPRRRLPRRSCS
jgi:hypothetical protein